MSPKLKIYLLPYLLLHLWTNPNLPACPPNLEQQLTQLIPKLTQTFVTIGGGSGVILSPNGYVLTNYHVTRNQKHWLVIRPGGQALPATLVGWDPEGDLALLKIHNAKNLPYAQLAKTQNLRAGDWVIALGNPWKLAGTSAYPTVTLGIISALHRYRGRYAAAIQIDAPINPGNSGGPTFNLNGKLVGINGMILTRFGRRTFSGIALAIPSHQIQRFLPLLKQGGEVRHGNIQGVRFENYQGKVRVQKVLSSQNPLQKGDILLSVNDITPLTPQHLYGIAFSYPAGTKLHCKILRGKQTLQISLYLQKKLTPQEALALGLPQRDPSVPYLGIDFANTFLNGGVEIIGIIADSPADKAGLKAGDIVLKFNGEKAEQPWDFESKINGSRFGETVQLLVLRGKQKLTFQLKIGNSDDFPLEKYSSKKQPQPHTQPHTQPKPPNSQPPNPTPTPQEVYPEDLGLTFGEINEKGVPIEKVEKNSIAEKYGLRPGDIVLKFNGNPPQDSFDLEEKIAQANPNQPFVFKILRNQKILTIQLLYKNTRN